MGVLRMGEGGPEAVPRRTCIRCMHCTAACPKQAVHFDDLTPAEEYRPVPDDLLVRLVQTRRSVRSFSPEPPPKELLQWALDLAQWAPSGKNAHAHRWTILYGPEAVARIRDQALEFCRASGEAPELPKLFSKGVDLLTCGAPCVILGWSPIDALNPTKDPAAALATAELLLHHRGVATCWGGYLNQLADASPDLRAALHIPETCRMQCALMAGYAKGERYPNIPYRPAAEPVWVE